MIRLMWTDVVDLRDFYATGLGQVARRMIRRCIREQWSDVRGHSILGIGYPTPYLTSFRDEASRIVAAMPAPQGVLHWPIDSRGLTTLVDECELPFEDLSMDRVLLIHAVECTEQIRPLLREVWRVLTGSGRLMVVVPNRRGLWARFERTPFGHGQPYSARQVTRLLRDNMFTPLESHRALFAPPSRSRMILSAAPALEKIGPGIINSFAGVIVIEAVKQIYAAPPLVQTARRRTMLGLTGRAPGSSTPLLIRPPGQP